MKEIDKIIEYIKLKCKEQRIICLNNLEYDKTSRYDVDEKSILNAPEPIIDVNHLLGET